MATYSVQNSQLPTPTTNSQQSNSSNLYQLNNRLPNAPLPLPSTITKSDDINSIIQPPKLLTPLSLHKMPPNYGLNAEEAALEWRRVQVALKDDANGIFSDTATKQKEFAKYMSVGKRNEEKVKKELKMTGRHTSSPHQVDEYTWYQDMKKLVHDAIKCSLHEDLDAFQFDELIKGLREASQSLPCLIKLDQELFLATNKYHMDEFFVYHLAVTARTDKLRAAAILHEDLKEKSKDTCI